jgi:hypothetical protein
VIQKQLNWKKTLDSESFDTCVAFYKKSGQEGPQFHLVPVQQSPVASLYEAIHGVYNPILSKYELAKGIKQQMN